MSNNGERGQRKRTNAMCPICRGDGWFVRRDVPVWDPTYGKLVPCDCTSTKMARADQGASRRARVTGTKPQAGKPRPRRRGERGAGRSASARPPQSDSQPQRSAETGVPLARDMTGFSYSKLATFEQCPLRFKLRYIDGEKTDDPRARDLKVGSMVHAALHALLTLEPHQRSESCLRTLFDSAWRTHCGRILWERGEKDYWEGAAWRCVSQYFSAVRQLPKPKKLEQQFSFDLGQWKIKGRIDRIDEPRPGEHEVIDYKAFEASLTEEQAISDLQTVLYYFGAKELCDVAPLRITYLFLQDGTAVTVRPNGTDMDEALSAVDALIAAIRACTDFPPRRNQFCGNCTESGKCAATKLAG